VAKYNVQDSNAPPPRLFSPYSQHMQEDLHPEEDCEAQEELGSDPKRLRRITPDLDDRPLTQHYCDFFDTLGAFDAHPTSAEQDTVGRSVSPTSTHPNPQNACPDDHMETDNVAAMPGPPPTAASRHKSPNTASKDRSPTPASRHRRRVARVKCAQAVPEPLAGAEASDGTSDAASMDDQAAVLLNLRELVEDCTTECVGANTEDIHEDLQWFMQVRRLKQIDHRAHLQSVQIRIQHAIFFM
jgi:hypothetical protein